MRIGRFLIAYSAPLLEAEALREALKTLEFIPVRVEALYYVDSLEYMGFSPMFREVAKGDDIPEYHLTLDPFKIEEMGNVQIH